MTGIIKKGATLLRKSGPAHDPNRQHLFVICTNACSNNQCLAVPICSKVNLKYDNACLIDTHEHQFIQHESYVSYNDAILIDADISTHTIKETMNAQTLLRICNGILKSKKIRQKYKRYYTENKNN